MLQRPKVAWKCYVRLATSEVIPPKDIYKTSALRSPTGPSSSRVVPLIVRSLRPGVVIRYLKVALQSPSPNKAGP